MLHTPEQALARSAVYEALSLSFLYPGDDVVEGLTGRVKELLRMPPGFMAEDLRIALERVGARLEGMEGGSLVDDFTSVFGHAVSKDCPPYEAEYGQPHIFQKSHGLADLSTFYAAFGVTPNRETRDRLDHISAELEFMHLIALKEAYALSTEQDDGNARICRQAEESFLSRHLAGWVLGFTNAVRRTAGQDSAYRLFADALELHMRLEFQAFQVEPTPARRARIEPAPEGGNECDGCPVLAAEPSGGMFR